MLTISILCSFLIHIVPIFGGRNLKECSNAYECQNKLTDANLIECSAFGACDSGTVRSKGKLGYIDCTGSHSCNEATSITAFKNVYCQGSNACFGSEKISAKIIQCSGGYACKSSGKIEAGTLMYCGGLQSCASSDIYAAKTIHCDGLSACSGTTLKSDDDILCTGSKSCLKGTITAPEGTVECSGNQACKRSKINAKKVKLHGAGSGQNTKIESENIEATGYEAISASEIRSKQNSTRLKVKTSGEAAGSDTTVVCNTGVECDVECTDECGGLEVLSYDGAVTTVTSAGDTCTGATTDGEGCPTVKVSSSTCEDREFDAYLKNKREIVYKRMMAEIARESETVFFGEKSRDEHHLLDADEGLQADVAHCDVAEACRGNNIINDDAQCYGYMSCQGGQINQTDNLAIVGAFAASSNEGGGIKSRGTIMCNAKQSCFDMKYFIGKSVQCGGYYSCANVKGVFKVTSLDCEATRSCSENVIEAQNTVKCLANRACYLSNVTAGNNILCEGHYGCSEGNLDAVGTIKCTSSGACHGSLVKSQKYVYVDGEYSATAATIYAPIVRVYGYQGIAGSTINSMGFATLTVKMYGDMAGNQGSILCQDGSKCKVLCESTGCKNLALVCLAGSECSTTPRECIQPRGPKAVEGVFCPVITISSSKQEDKQLLQYLEQRKRERVNDEAFVQIINAYDSHIEEQEGLLDQELMVQEIEMSQANNGWNGKYVSWDLVTGAILLVIAMVVLYFGCHYLKGKNHDIATYQYLK